VISERDILGTQLVRRNDEVALLYEKIKIQQSTLHKGEAQYAQRVEDVRVLKLEIRKLRRERMLLQKSVANVEDLKSVKSRGVVVNFDLGERFPRPRSQQRGSLRPRARRVAVLGDGAGGDRRPRNFF